MGRFRNRRTGRIKKKQEHCRSGRVFVSLVPDEIVQSKSHISRWTAPLIARAFIPNPDNKPQVDHVDGIKTSEAITNLEWVDQSTNVQRSFDNGQHPYRPAHDFLTEDDYQRVRDLSAAGFSQVKIGKLMGISNSTASKILSGKIRVKVVRQRQRRVSTNERFLARLAEARVHLAEAKGRLTCVMLGEKMRVSKVTAWRYLQAVKAEVG